MRGKGVSVRETEREKERDTAGKGVRDKRKGKETGRRARYSQRRKWNNIKLEHNFLSHYSVRYPSKHITQSLNIIRGWLISIGAAGNILTRSHGGEESGSLICSGCRVGEDTSR